MCWCTHAHTNTHWPCRRTCCVHVQEERLSTSTSSMCIYSIPLCLCSVFVCSCSWLLLCMCLMNTCINSVSPSGWFFFFPFFFWRGAIYLLMFTVINKGKHASTNANTKKMRTLRKPAHQFAPRAQHLENALQIHTTQTDTWTCFPKRFHEEKHVYMETMQSQNQQMHHNHRFSFSHYNRSASGLRRALTAWTRASFVVWLVVIFGISVHLRTVHLICCHIKLLWNVLILDATPKRIFQSCCMFSSTVSI